MTKQIADYLLTNGTLVTDETTQQGNIALKDGKIIALGDTSNIAPDKTIDCRGLHILPGVIDSQVHFRDPGATHKEDLETGSLGAAMGGVTTFFEMPNTNPNTDNAEALLFKLKRAHDVCHTNFAFFIGATAKNANHLDTLEVLDGCVGIKVFMGSSTGSLLVSDDDTLEQVLGCGHRRVAIHAEDEQRLIERKEIAQRAKNPEVHPLWRDDIVALQATQRILSIAKKTKRPLHILHISTAEEMKFLATQKAFTTVEVTPQHLTLFAPECYQRLGTFAQMNPPIRTKDHQEALWEGVRNKTVDIIGSDHAPHTIKEKNARYPNSPSGMPGVQTLVPIMLTHVNNNRLSLCDFVRLTNTNPAKIYHVKNKGALEVGFDADLTIVDMKADRTITNDWIASRCGWTPFDGLNVSAWPIMTFVQGQLVMRNDTLVTPNCGQQVAFNTAL